MITGTWLRWRKITRKLLNRRSLLLKRNISCSLSFFVIHLFSVVFFSFVVLDGTDYLKVLSIVVVDSSLCPFSLVLDLLSVFL